MGYGNMFVSKSNERRIVAGSALVGVFMIVISLPFSWSGGWALFLGGITSLYTLYLAYKVLSDPTADSNFTFEEKFYEKGSLRSGVTDSTDV